MNLSNVCLGLEIAFYILSMPSLCLTVVSILTIFCATALPLVHFNDEVEWDTETPTNKNKAERDTVTPTYKLGEVLQFQIVDPTKANERVKQPWMRLYPENKDSKGQDASSVVSTLKWARGTSKLLPEEDKKPGLVVIIRGIKLTPSDDKKHYIAKFLGEYKATEAKIPLKDIEDLLEEKPITLNFPQSVTANTGFTRYNVKTQVALKVKLSGKNLQIFGLDGGGSIETVGFSNTATYPSPPVKIESVDGTTPIYLGTPAQLPDLPVLK